MTEVIRLADHRARRGRPSADAAAPRVPPVAVTGEPTAPDIDALRRRMRTTGALLAALLIAKLAAVILWIAPSIVLPADAAQWQAAALGWLAHHTALRIALLAVTGLAFYGALIFAAVSFWPALPRPSVPEPLSTGERTAAGTAVLETGNGRALPMGSGAPSRGESRGGGESQGGGSQRKPRGPRPCS